jgi:hypothetical protein
MWILAVRVLLGQATARQGQAIELHLGIPLPRQTTVLQLRNRWGQVAEIPTGTGYLAGTGYRRISLSTPPLRGPESGFDTNGGGG